MPQESCHPKLLCNQRVQVAQKASNTAHAAGRKQEAILEEISVTSATLRLQCPIRTGSRVSIDCANCDLRGEVVGCAERAGDYAVAIQLDEDSPWSKAVFVPEGLLNPKYLRCANEHCIPDCDSQECSGGSRSDLHICL